MSARSHGQDHAQPRAKPHQAADGKTSCGRSSCSATDTPARSATKASAPATPPRSTRCSQPHAGRNSRSIQATRERPASSATRQRRSPPTVAYPNHHAPPPERPPATSSAPVRARAAPRIPPGGPPLPPGARADAAGFCEIWSVRVVEVFAGGGYALRIWLSSNSFEVAYCAAAQRVSRSRYGVRAFLI